MKIYRSFSELVGKTPLLELQNLEKLIDTKAKILAKVEFFNPAGSVKDRVAVNMIDRAEKEGRITRDTVIIEPTSGNTGGSETIVNKAENDDVGNKIRLTYAPKTKLDNLENKVNNLVAYGNVVHRAECDDEGNKIRYVYARKDEVQNNLNIVHDIISLEGDKEIDAIPDARAVKTYSFNLQNDVVGYVDRAIGDIETSLENIITKYGLGGDSK